MLVLKIRGVVRERESGIGIPGLHVEVSGEDGRFESPFGRTYADGAGRFEIVRELNPTGEFLDVKPDLYVRLLAPDGGRLVYESDTPARWAGWDIEEFDIRVPRRQLGDFAPERGIWLLADDRSVRETFDVGEPLLIRMAGLPPVSPIDVVLRDSAGSRLFGSRLVSDATGGVEPTTIWPHAGLDDPRSNELLTLRQAQARWRGQVLTLEARDPDTSVIEGSFRFTEAFSRPLLLTTDPEGFPLGGFEAGTHDVVVSGFNLAGPGRFRVHMVPRQWGWSPGDVFAAVQLEGGGLGFADVDLDDGQGDFQVRVARASEVAPGAYDFIVRRLRYGYEDEEDLRLRYSDLVAYRSQTGLVVRQEFMQSKTVLGGCVNALQIGGRRILEAPYFQYADTFQSGENIYGALDPAALAPGQTGKVVALYVIKHPKPVTYQGPGGLPMTRPWDRKLSHLSILGGNSSVQTMKTQLGCINFNTRLLWPNASLEGEYDIVADFGNNVPDSNSFVSDAHFDPPLDIIDGYFKAGFRIVPDPAVHTEFTDSGSFIYGPVSYNTYTDIEFVVVNGQSQQVPVNFLVPIQGKVFFPADAPGATSPTQISAREPSYPLVVIVHGQGHSYLGYDRLLEHLARNGFIAAAIHCELGMHGMSRARLLFDHLPILKGKFGTKMDPVMGLMGHSRGGEAVVMAPRLNNEEGLGYWFGAIVSLAPTSQYLYKTPTSGPDPPSLESFWANPYLVLYGGMDEDVAGYPDQTGFVLYDRARDARRCMVFVHGATHNGFIGANPGFGAKLGMGSDKMQLLQPSTQELIAKAYVMAFFRQHLYGDTRWADMLRGAWTSAAVRQAEGGKARLYIQYGEYGDSLFVSAGTFVIDEFEDANWQASTIGGAVTDDATLPTPPVEGPLFPADVHSPHATSGLTLKWDNTGDRLRFTIPSGYRDMSKQSAISFRIGQKTGSPSNPVGKTQDLYVTLTDGLGASRSIKASKFAEIPAPQEREVANYTKSAMCSVRIPLHVFATEVLNTPRVNLTDVVSVALSFGLTSTGEIEIDNVEFVSD